MSWDWNDRDLLDWAKRTLPEFLLASMKHPSSGEAIAITPWECFEVSVYRVQIDGEMTLTGKKEQAFLAFDFDIGLQIDIRKRIPIYGEEDYIQEWTGVAHLRGFEGTNMQPDVETKMTDMYEDVGEEVGWYLREGMGKQYLWHGLARWNAYAIKKWMKCDPPEIEDPFANPVEPPIVPPFREDWRQIAEEEVRRDIESAQKSLPDGGAKAKALDWVDSEPSRARELAFDIFKNKQLPQDLSLPLVGTKLTDIVAEEAAHDLPESDDDWEEEEDTNSNDMMNVGGFIIRRRKAGARERKRKLDRYPFLPSMMCGVGGPSTQWLRPKDCISNSLDWYDQKLQEKNARLGSRESLGLGNGGVTQLDLVLEKARKRRLELEEAAGGRTTAVQALELHEAIQTGDVMRCFAKLDKNSVNFPHPHSGRCAVHFCVEKASPELLEMIIEANADVNLKDVAGQTPLMMAARQGSKELSKILLEAGADAAQEDDLGRSAGDMVKVIEPEKDHPLKKWKDKMTIKGPEDPAKETKELKELIEEKEKPKKYGNMLLEAITRRDFRTAESSIKNGANVDIIDDKGDSPLLLVAKLKWKNQEGLLIRLAERLQKAGANINFQNVSGNTPLLYAAHRGNCSLVDKFLEFKADATLSNAEGNTALMYAAHGGYETICTALLENFALPDARNKFGFTAAQMAQKKGFLSCVVLCEAYEQCPKQAGDTEMRKRRVGNKDEPRSFDYSKWDALQKEMKEDEEIEERIRENEAHALMQKPTPKMVDFGPEAFGLPSDTPWPPPCPEQKGTFDYSRWDKIVTDAEQTLFIQDRVDYLQRNPQYTWVNGEKHRVLW